MPARWQSSQRPLFVRTVWVNGLRHAILSADDPLLQYAAAANASVHTSPSSVPAPRVGSCSSAETPPSSPASSSGAPAPSSPTRSDDLQHCLVKLQLVRTQPRPQTVVPSSVTSKNATSTSVSTTGLEITEPSSPRPPTPPAPPPPPPPPDPPYYQLETNEKPLPPDPPMVGRYRRPYLPYLFRRRSSSSESSDDMDSVSEGWFLQGVESFLPELQLNPLSERVLQWLDLAGRSTTVGVVPASPPKPVPVQRRPPMQWRRPKRRTALLTSAPIRQCFFSLPRAHSEDHPSSPSSGDSPHDEQLLVSARGFNARRCPSHSTSTTTTATAGSARETPEEATQPPPPAVLPPRTRTHRPVPLRSRPLPHTSTPTQPPPPPEAKAQEGQSRPQLHIFLPALPRDRPPLCHQDADSLPDSDSSWSES